MNHKFLQIHPQDNVLVALADLNSGETIAFDGKSILLKDNIPAKHKFAITDLRSGELIYMYGSIVGKALSDIHSGGVLTVSNVAHKANSFGEKSGEYRWSAPDISRFENRTFMGSVSIHI